MNTPFANHEDDITALPDEITESSSSGRATGGTLSKESPTAQSPTTSVTADESGFIVGGFTASSEAEKGTPTQDGSPFADDVEEVSELPWGHDLHPKAQVPFGEGVKRAERQLTSLFSDPEPADESVPVRAVSKKKGNIYVNERDLTLTRFLVRYGFAYTESLARLVDSTPESIRKRLAQLEQVGLVKKQALLGRTVLYLPTAEAIALHGYNFREANEVKLSSVQHTIAVTNIGAELEREAGGKDVLGLSRIFGEPFPQKHRFKGGYNLFGEPIDEVEIALGEMTITEREIRSWEKMNRSEMENSDRRRAILKSSQDPTFPELRAGNEWQFVVIGEGGKATQHTPDLVVTRPRNSDGTVASIAVEVELSQKKPEEYRHILRLYRSYGSLYQRVIYITHRRAIAEMILKVSEEVGVLEGDAGDAPKVTVLRYLPMDKKRLILG